MENKVKMSFFDVEGSEKNQVINHDTTLRKYQLQKYGEFFGENIVLDEFVSKIEEYISKHESYLIQLNELWEKGKAAIRQEEAATINLAIKVMSVEALEAALQQKKAQEAGTAA